MCCIHKKIDYLVNCLETLPPPPIRNSKQDNTALFFSCDSFCAPHFQKQAELALELSEIGYEVKFLNFPLSHFLCSVENKIRLSALDSTVRFYEINNQIINLYCDKNELARLGKLDIKSNVDEKKRKIADLLDYVFSFVEDKELINLSIDKVKISEICMKDIGLTYKACLNTIIESPKEYLYSKLIDSIKFNIWLLIEIVSNTWKSSYGFCMSDYTGCSIFFLACKLIGIKTRYFDIPSIGGVYAEEILNCERLVKIQGTPGDNILMYNNSNQKKFNTFELNTSSTKFVESIIKKKMFGEGGAQCYSPKHDATSSDLEKLSKKISSAKARGMKIITIYTSSMDEVYVWGYTFNQYETDISYLYTNPFKSQEEWIKDTIEFINSEYKSNCLVIVRMHPRLGKDHRGGTISPEYKLIYPLIQEINGLENCIIVEPNDSVSSYWLGEQSDLILNGWSSIGLEMSMLGKIVINTFYKCMPGAGTYSILGNTSELKSKDEYYHRIKAALSMLTLPTEEDCEELGIVTRKEASKSYFISCMTAIIDINDHKSMVRQIQNPRLFTPFLASFHDSLLNK